MQLHNWLLIIKNWLKFIHFWLRSHAVFFIVFIIVSCFLFHFLNWLSLLVTFDWTNSQNSETTTKVNLYLHKNETQRCKMFKDVTKIWYEIKYNETIWKHDKKIIKCVWCIFSCFFLFFLLNYCVYSFIKLHNNNNYRDSIEK